MLACTTCVPVWGSRLSYKPSEEQALLSSVRLFCTHEPRVSWPSQLGVLVLTKDLILIVQAGHYMDDGSGLSGVESLPEKGKAPAEALLRAENLKRKCIKVESSPYLRLDKSYTGPFVHGLCDDGSLDSIFLLACQHKLS